MAPKKVVVVGAGAAGMACAESLSHHSDRFEVTLIEAQDYTGGQAFSIPIDKEKFGAEWLNQGVQGGSYIYKHTMRQFKLQGESEQHVDLQVSFGLGDKFWTNMFPTVLLTKHTSSIRRFNRFLKVVKWTPFFWALIPLRISLKMFFFSEEFINTMIYPSLALFLGTGNATPHLPTIIMERLYNNPTIGMWYPPSKNALSDHLPPMIVFPNESQFYGSWQKTLEERGVKVLDLEFPLEALYTRAEHLTPSQVRLNTTVSSILSRSSTGVKYTTRRTSHALESTESTAERESREDEEHCDEIVFCTLADTAQKILGKQAKWVEKKVLGGTKWSDDVTVTHNDTQYMEKWYENHFTEDLAVKTLAGEDEQAKYDRGKKGFKPMYYIKQVPANPKLLEMSFDCTNFQAQFPSDLPFDRHVFQTIFLNKKDESTWTKDEIDPSKIIRIDWWHQLCHNWTHYAFVVPFVWTLNSASRHTRFAGSWTLVNAHECAMISGMAAAYQLGAEYPEDLEQDGFALLCFRLYLLLFHLKWYKKGSNREAK